MANIVGPDYDLSNGDTTSSVVSSPNNVRLSWEVSGASDENKVVTMQWWIQGDSESYNQLKDENGEFIISKQIGNGAGSTNVFGVNATNFKVEVVVDSGHDGTLNVYALNS